MAPTPFKIRLNEATEVYKESKQGFLGVPNASRLFPEGYYMYFTCIHMFPLISCKRMFVVDVIMREAEPELRTFHQSLDSWRTTTTRNQDQSAPCWRCYKY